MADAVGRRVKKRTCSAQPSKDKKQRKNTTPITKISTKSAPKHENVDKTHSNPANLQKNTTKRTKNAKSIKTSQKNTTKHKKNTKSLKKIIATP